MKQRRVKTLIFCINGIGCLLYASCNSNSASAPTPTTKASAKSQPHLPTTPTSQPASSAMATLKYSAPVQGIAVGLTGPSEVSAAKVAETRFDAHVLNSSVKSLAFSIHPTAILLVIRDSMGKVVANTAWANASAHFRRTNFRGLRILTEEESIQFGCYAYPLTRLKPGRYTAVIKTAPPSEVWKPAVQTMLQQDGIKVWGPATVTSPPFPFVIKADPR